MLPDDLLRAILTRLEALEADRHMRRESTRRRSALLRTAGKLCPVLAVLGLATWALGQGVEIKTDNGAATDVQRFKVETGGATVSAYFLNAVVGIGTNAPVSNLHVYGTSNNSHSLILDAQGTGNAQQATVNLLTLGDGAKNLGNAATRGWHFTARGNAYSAAAEQNDLQLYYWDGATFATRTAWDNAGNVGIGTTSPAARLEIGGTPNDAIRHAYLNMSANNTTVTDRPYFRGLLDHFVLCPASNRTGGADANTMYLSYPGDLTAGDTVNTRLQESLFITATGSAGGGSVGIGTAAPAAQLEVAGTGDIQLTESSPQIKFHDSDGGAWRYWIHNNSNKLYFLNDGGAGGGWTASRPLTIEQDNVGISDSTPSYDLDVAGTIQAQDVFGSGGQNIRVGDDTYLTDVDAAHTLGIYSTSDTNKGYLRLGSNSLNTLYGDGASGRIGVNDSAPSSQFHVTCNGGCALTLNRNTNDGWVQSFERGGGTVGVISVAAGVMTYGTFSAFHYAWREEDERPSDEGHLEQWSLVVATGRNKMMNGRPEGDGETVYGIAPTTIPEDKRVLGAYLLKDLEHPEKWHQVMAVGNGYLLVTDANGDIESGDYVTSSTRAGYGQRQSSPGLMNFTVAKAMETVTWSKVPVDPKKGFRWKLLAVTYTAGG